MVRKPRFKPKITRVKLNPEQAVLACNCWSTGYSYAGTNPWVGSGSVYEVCTSRERTMTITGDCFGGGSVPGYHPFGTSSFS